MKTIDTERTTPSHLRVVRTEGAEMKYFGSRNDLENWVDNRTTNWDNRTDDDIENIVRAISDMDHPLYGCADWESFLESLDLSALAEAHDDN